MPGPEKPNVLLVDGHNVIHAWPGLSEFQAQGLGARARAELVQHLTSLQDATGTRVVLIFDGCGETASEETEPRGIQVFYASGGSNADAIIGRLAAKYADIYRLTVATDDLAVQDAIASAGGSSLSTEGLRDLIERSTADFRRRWGL